jgi:membrane protease YdiL (CAAX protease family)
MGSIWLFILIVGMALPLAIPLQGYTFLIYHAPALLALLLVAAVGMIWGMYSSARKAQAGSEPRTLRQQVMPIIALVSLLISIPMLFGLLMPSECTSSEAGSDLSFSSCMGLASERVQHY